MRKRTAPIQRDALSVLFALPRISALPRARNSDRIMHSERHSRALRLLLHRGGEIIGACRGG